MRAFVGRDERQTTVNREQKTENSSRNRFREFLAGDRWIEETRRVARGYDPCFRSAVSGPSGGGSRIS
jgi:hypothetical protein